MSTVVRDTIKPVLQDLSDDRLLSKCLHGKIQNNKEAINNIVWNRFTKNVFVGRQILNVGILSVVISYNDGASGLTGVFNLIKVKPGIFC